MPSLHRFDRFVLFKQKIAKVAKKNGFAFFGAKMGVCGGRMAHYTHGFSLWRLYSDEGSTLISWSSFSSNGFSTAQFGYTGTVPVD
jgi:hypothetical protein